MWENKCITTYRANFDNNFKDNSYAISSPVRLPEVKNPRSLKNRATAVLAICEPHLSMERVSCRLVFRKYWVIFFSVATTPLIDLMPDSERKITILVSITKLKCQNLNVLNVF